MNILSDNDWKALSDALGRMEALSMTRTMGSVEVTAEIAKATHPWPVEMLVGVTVSRHGRVEQRQWFESAEAAKRETGRWKV